MHKIYQVVSIFIDYKLVNLWIQRKCYYLSSPAKRGFIPRLYEQC
jgi:hypothetical protein